VVGSGDGTPDCDEVPVSAPSPESFVASLRENPFERAEAKRGKFAVVVTFVKPSVLLDEVVV